MNCPWCKLAAIIDRSHYKVLNDDTPDAETELYLVQDLKCRNPQCDHCGEIVNTIEHRIEL